jgi:DNA-binding NarL/FixJ family response regulator
MRHWIIDREAVVLDSWREAFPQVQVIARANLARHAFTGSGIVWARLRFAEPVAAALAGIDRSGGQAIVLLADAPDERLVLQALALGASGCCNSRAAPDVLRQVALVVANGGLWVGQSLLRQLLGATTRRFDQLPQPAGAVAWERSLSVREIQVARLVAGGGSNKEIARQLAITERTVKAHLSAIFEKLGVRDRLQLSLKVNGRLN